MRHDISWCFSVLSVRFNGHFPGEPGLAGVYWNKGWWRWWWQLDYWSYKSCKASVKSSSDSFLQAGCPSCHPTNSVKALKGKYCKQTYDVMTVYGTKQDAWPNIASSVPAGNGGFIGLEFTACFSATVTASSDPIMHNTKTLLDARLPEI